MNPFGDAVILCGGKSSRMDSDKAFAKINGRYIIEIIHEKLSACFSNVRLCADARERFSPFGLEVIEYRIKGGFGPAVGIYSALSQAASGYIFVTACDMPLIDIGHIAFMKRALAYHDFKPDALVPMYGEFIEPLYSFYSAGIAAVFEEEMEKGNYKIHRILDRCDTLYLDEKYSRLFDENLSMFTNINYAADLEMVSWKMKLK